MEIIAQYDGREETLEKGPLGSSDAEIKADVYIRPDQTLKQQLESKNLRDQLRQMNQESGAKKYYIRRGEIVEREEEED